MPKKDVNPMKLDNQVKDIKKGMKTLQEEGKPPKVKKSKRKKSKGK